jgi:hypothetical protein
MKKRGGTQSDGANLPPEDDPAQSARFRQTAEEVGAANGSDALDRVMEAIMKSLPEDPPEAKKPAK